MRGFKKIFFFTLFIYLQFNGVAQDCNIVSKANDIQPDKLCAPVSVDWEVTYRGVNDGGTGDVYFEYDWNDGNAPEVVAATNTGPGEWTFTHNHVYPKGGDLCNYHPTVTLIVAGNACTSSIQEQIVTVWDTDDLNGGEMIINPQVFPICVGNDGTVNFVDVSQWNCTPPDENDAINDRNRWVQWIYGTAGTITDAQIGGSVRPWPYTGTIDYVPGPVEGPVAPYNSALPVYIPNGWAVGDFFEITLKNWNACNPYDDPTIPGPPADPVNGDYPPVETTAIAIIVDYPDATITPAGPFCDNAPSVKLTAATGGGTWSGTGITDSDAGIFDPEVAGPGSHIITYSVTNSDGCAGTDNETIIVNPSPSINMNVGPITYLCPGILQSLDGDPSGGTTPYASHSWTGDIVPLSSSSIANPVFQTTVIGDYDLTYRVTDDMGCFDEEDISISVDTINIYFERPYVNICANRPSVLDPSPVGGSGIFTVHQWSGDSIHLLSATDVEMPVMTATVPGLYKFYYYVQSDQGCDASDSVTVAVREVPDVYAGMDASICGYKHKFSATISYGTGEWIQKSGPGHSVFQDVHDPESEVQVDMYGTYEYKWMADNFDCADSSFVTVIYTQTPVPSVMNDKDTCALQSPVIAYPDIGSGQWQVAQSPVSSNIVFDDILDPTTNVTVDKPGVYKFAWLEDNGGCFGSDTVQIEFYPNPDALLEPFDLNGCNEYAINFSNISTDADNYLWDFGDGFISNQKNPVHTFENITQGLKIFNVAMVASNVHLCKDTLKFDIEVAPSPDARFVPDVSTGCTPLNVNFINQSSGAQSYLWDFGDGSPKNGIETPVHTFLNNETYVEAYEVVLAVENEYNCTDTARSYITVFPNLNIQFKAVPEEGCNPLRVDFVADPGAYAYRWDFGDGDVFDGTSVNSHLYETNSNVNEEFNVSLLTTSIFGCRDTAEVQIEVKPSPVASFDMDKNEGCSPLVVKFNNTSTDIALSTWKFDNGDIFNIPSNGSISYEFDNNGFAPDWSTVKLIVENDAGCMDSVEHNIQVFPEVGASIVPSDPGCSPHMALFPNETTGGRTFEWNYGDGAISSSFMGTHQYEYEGDVEKTYDVSMVATSIYGCKDTAWTTVTIWPTPLADFAPDPVEQYMPLSTFNFNNKTLGLGWTYEWDFGDGNSSIETSPVHEYGKSGTFKITLKVNGELCSDSFSDEVVVHPMKPEIHYGPDAEGCPPLKVEFINDTEGAAEYLWEFGDGNSSNVEDPVHVYNKPGEYTVRLTAYAEDATVDNSVAEDVRIIVYETPLAYFSVDPIFVKLPGPPIKFTDESSDDVVSWTWDFGDENASSEQNPYHEYTSEGTFHVTLDVVNDKGCTASYTKTDAVTTEPAGEIKYPNAFTPNLSGPNGGHYDDPVVREGNYVFYPYAEEGIMEYKLQIFTRWGELIFESNEVKVGWDGYLNNHLCEQGVYIYKAVVKFSNGKSKIFTGDVTLLR